MDDLVTLASSFFEACSIEDNNPAALIADEPSLLKRPGDERDGCSAHPEHLRQKLLGHRKRVRVNSILRLQQPSGKPRFHAVNGIACGNLLRFDPKHLRIVCDDVFDGIVLTDSTFKHVSRNMRHRATYLYHASPESTSFSQSPSQPDRPLAT